MFFAVLVAWAAPLVAAPVDVRVTLAAPAGLAPGTALRLVATHAGYAGVTASPPADASGRESTAELTARGALLRLAPGLWTLDARGDGWWVASRDIFVEQAALEISLSAWPAATVSGHVTPPASEAAPEFVTLELESPPAARGEPDARPVPRSRVRCPVVDAAWRCEIPAAPLDLRVEASGFVPHYFRDSTCAPGKTLDLGALALRRGASVVGWVKHADGRGAIGAQVVIADATQQPIVADARVPGPPKPAFSATADARGFFQITGVPPADALVVASLTGMASDHTAIRPLPERELRLLSPLVLAPPAALDVEVDPPLGPGGKHWTLDIVAQPPPGSARARKLVEGAAVDGAGRWHGRNLPLVAGDYVFTVGLESGEKWAQEIVTVQPGQLVRLAVPAVRVRGVVTLGQEPLRARVVFGGEQGAVRLAFDSDEKGEFRGLLSAAGGDDAREWSVFVEAQEPPVRRNFEHVKVEPGLDGEAQVELHLPATRLTGEIVDLFDRPVSSPAIVTAQHARGEDLVQVVTREEERGKFRFEGLPPGDYVVSAKTRGASSDYTAVTLEDEAAQPAHVHLVLRDEVRLTVRVLTPEGTAVPGAFVKAASAENPLMPAAPLRTDEQGRATVRLPASTQALCVVVRAFGLAYKIGCVPLPAPETPELALTLDRSGGRLALTLPLAEAGRMVYLLHAGFVEPLPFVQSWAALQDGGATGSGDVVLPQMEAGAYTVCLAEPGLMPTLLAGARPPRRCVSGTLPAGGELTLAVPGDAPPAPGGAK